MAERKTYLGDGAYAEFDGFAIVLTTSNGLQTTNRIVLEPAVFQALQRWARVAMQAASSGGEPPE